MNCMDPTAVIVAEAMLGAVIVALFTYATVMRARLHHMIVLFGGAINHLSKVTDALGEANKLLEAGTDSTPSSVQP